MAAEPSLVDQLTKLVTSSLEDMHARQQKMPRYAEEKFWDERYGTGDASQWYCGFSTLYPYLMSLGINEGSKILVVGCGTSTFSEDLYNFGFHNITNVDFSEIAIDQMREKYHALKDMKWLEADARDMSKLFESNTFDFVVDIGTFDAIMCGTEDDGKKALTEMLRVLKVGGSLAIVSHSTHESRPAVFFAPHPSSLTLNLLTLSETARTSLVSRRASQPSDRQTSQSSRSSPAAPEPRTNSPTSSSAKPQTDTSISSPEGSMHSAASLSQGSATHGTSQSPHPSPAAPLCTPLIRATEFRSQLITSENDSSCQFLISASKPELELSSLSKQSDTS